MSRHDEPLTEAAIWEAAVRTIEAHAGSGWCYCCTLLDGCPQLRWAYDVQRTRLGARPASVVPLLLAATRP